MKKNLKSFLIFTLCLCFLASSYGTELVVLAKNTDKENNSQVEWIDDDEEDEDNDDDEETSENENQSNAGQSEDDANKAKLEELTKESKKLETSWGTFAIILVTDKGGVCQGEEEVVLRSVTL